MSKEQTKNKTKNMINRQNLVKLFSVIILGVMFSACQPKEAPKEIAIIPKPVSLQQEKGEFVITSKTPIIITDENSELEKIGKHLAGLLSNGLEKELTLSQGQAKNGAIILTIDKALNKEAYQLSITSKRITLSASSAEGAFWGVQTLRQLLPVSVDAAHARESLAVQAVQISDEPRFAYRGMHLDVGRHFFPVKFIKNFIDILAMHKMNTFHWHLTEDQGWRIEIKKYPKLGEIASKRKETVIGHNSGKYDGKPYGGYYTQEEVKEIVKYAADRYITIIPEIELPGHSKAALTAYPELGCTGGPYEVATQWGVFPDVYCAGNEKTFQFMEDVLSEVCDLFPSKYIHIGGDECPKAQWEKCPKCQARIRKEGLKNEHELQSYFIQRMEKFLHSKGRRIIGWDEILEGGLAEDATVMSWRGIKGGIEAARMHHDVIMTPNSHLYFDHYQSRDVKNEPIAIGGFTDVENVYSYEPIPEELSAEEAKHVLGAQANVWTEYIPTTKQVEYMVLPRIAALSEVVWTPKEQKDFQDFSKRLPSLLQRYDAKGWNYATHIFQASIRTQNDFANGAIKVEMTAGDGSQPIYYTMDGSEPTDKSTPYSTPLTIKESVVINAVAYNNEKPVLPYASKVFHFSKATCKKITLAHDPETNYKYNGAVQLINGQKGSTSFGDGNWLGFQNNDLEASINLIESMKVSKVSLTALHSQGNWIFQPKAIEVAVSLDGESFKTVKSIENIITKKDTPNGIKTFDLEFPIQEARFVKVIAKRQKLPKWHGGAGQDAYIFVDEISIY